LQGLGPGGRENRDFAAAGNDRVAAVVLALRAITDGVVGAVQVPDSVGLDRDKNTQQRRQQQCRQRPGAS
jgi:hypothetical protein